MRPPSSPDSREPSLLWRLIGPYWTRAGRTAASNLGWLLALTVLTQLAAVASVILLTGGLGQEKFGILAFGLALQGYLLTVAQFGTPWIVIREVAASPAHLDRVTTSLLVIAGGASLVVGSLLIIATRFSPVGKDERTLLTLIGLGIMASWLDVRCLFDVHHKQRYSAWIVLLAESGSLALLVVLIGLGRLTLSSVGAILAARMLLVGGGHLGFYHWRIHRIGWRYSSNETNRILRASLPMLIATLLATAPFTTGIFFLRGVSPPRELGLFGLVQQIGLGHLLLVGLAGRVLRPHISGPFGRHAEFLRKLERFGLGFISSLFVAGVAGTYVLIYGFLDRPYREAFPAAVLMLTATSVTFLSVVAAAYLIDAHREWRVLAIDAFVTAAFVSGALWAAPRFGFEGVVVLTLTVCVVRAVLLAWSAVGRALRRRSLSDPGSMWVMRAGYGLFLVAMRPVWWLSARFAEPSGEVSAPQRPRVLLLAHNELMARYARLVADALRDTGVSLEFTRPPLVDRGVTLDEIRHRIGVPHAPFWRTLCTRWDLIVATDHFPAAAYRPGIPKVFISHGLYSGKILGRNNYIYGPRALRWNGRPLYSLMFAAGEIERQCAEQINPRLAGRVAVTGDPFVDLLLERDRQRARVRSRMGLGDRPVVLIMSSWGEESLIRTSGPALLESAARLNREYQFVLSIHPNNLSRATESVDWGTFLDRQQSAGIEVVSPREQWLDYLVAADLVISDFTSLCLYFLQLARPLLLVPFACDRMFDDGSPMARLYDIAPRLASPDDLADALEEALTRAVSPRMNILAEQMVAHKGDASSTCAARIASLLPPQHSGAVAVEAP